MRAKWLLVPCLVALVVSGAASVAADVDDPTTLTANPPPQPPGIEWVRQYSSGSDEGLAVAADGAGAVYVTGLVDGRLEDTVALGAFDLFVRKYDAGGRKEWTRQYGTSHNQEGAGIAVFGTKAIYVVGTTEVARAGQRPSDDWDVLVLKYDASGNELWTRRFGTDSLDRGLAVAVDANGAVYVAGWTSGALPGQTKEGSTDAFVRKYDASGTEVWTRQFGSPEWSRIDAVTVDAANDVYVVGSVAGTLPDQATTGDIDAFVRKYDPSGEEIWTRQFGTTGSDGAQGVAAYGSTVFVTGSAGTSLPGQTTNGLSDAYVRSYSASGNESWTRQFGTAGSDSGRAVAVDGEGGLYVMGAADGALPGQLPNRERGVFVRKYHAKTAEEVWTHQAYSQLGTGVAVANADAIYVTGTVTGALPDHTSRGDKDVILRKHDASGDEAWTRQFGAFTPDDGYAVAVGPDGAIHVTGNRWWNGGVGTPVLTYDPAGNLMRQSVISSEETDVGKGIAADEVGAVFVAGHTTGELGRQTSLGGRDAFLHKVGADGRDAWTRQFGSAATDAASGVAVGGGAIAVIGTTTGQLPGQTAGGSRDVFIKVFDTDGTEVWTRQFGTVESEEGNGVAIDVDGFVYVAGSTDGVLPGKTSSGASDGFVAMYDTSGDEVWTRQFGSEESDYVKAVAANADGSVYLAGYTNGTLPGQTSAGGIDVFVRKYTSSGSVAWTRQFGSTKSDLGWGVAVDSNGAVFVTGSTGGILPGQTSKGENDVFVRKYDSQGNLMWTRQFGTTSHDTGFGIAARTAESVFVAGTTHGTFTGEVQGDEDIFLARLANDSPTCNGLDATIAGTGVVVGTPGADVIVGGIGDDEIRGLAGDDVICGGGGDDIVIGGTGDDVLFGGAGNDLIKGLPGNDTLYGGLGDDRLQGNAGEDVLNGGDGQDRLWGGIEADTLSGHTGNDQLRGGPGNDTLDGGPGTDRIWGDAGDDTAAGGVNSDYLYGGIGNDVLRGNDGHDRLYGYTGADKLYGGRGRDQLRGQQGDDTVDGGPDYDFCSVETVWVDCEAPI